MTGSLEYKDGKWEAEDDCCDSIIEYAGKETLEAIVEYLNKHSHPEFPNDRYKQDSNGDIVGFVMTIPELGGTWMYLGSTPKEVAHSIEAELEGYCHPQLSADEIDKMVIEARKFTPDEIENMPEFPGW